MLKVVEMTMNASGSFTNGSNHWIYAYGNQTVTIKDASGNVVQISQVPCWIPPQWSISTGTAAQIIMGLEGELPEFAGFLSKRPSAAVAPIQGLGVTTGVGNFSTTEFENWNNPNTGGLANLVETEAWTHNP